MMGVCKDNKKADATFVVMGQAVFKHFMFQEAMDHYNHLHRKRVTSLNTSIHTYHS